MSGSPTFQRLSKESLEEHRQIHFYLDQITQTLELLTPDLDDVEPMRRLAAQLGGLLERLAEHQRIEEGGLFRAVLDLLPGQRVEIDRLANQHGRMVEILEVAKLHALEVEPSGAVELRDDLAGFLETFREHELAEEELLAQAIEKERGEL